MADPHRPVRPAGPGRPERQPPAGLGVPARRVRAETSSPTRPARPIATGRLRRPPAAGRFERCDVRDEHLPAPGLPEVVDAVRGGRGPRRGAVLVGRRGWNGDGRPANGAGPKELPAGPLAGAACRIVGCTSSRRFRPDQARRSRRRRLREARGTDGRGGPGRSCRSCPAPPGRHRGREAPVGAYCTMYALRTASVRFGPVRCGVSDENTTMPAGAHRRRDRDRRLGEALPAERLDVGVCERADAVQPGRHAGQPLSSVASVSAIQQREVLLRLDERVAVVLVPREPARLLGLLVHGLVPVEVDVGADDVSAQAEQGRVASEVGQERRLAGEVGART